MKKIAIYICILFLISCKKEVVSNNILQGIWVEKTLRLDTIDFSLNTRIDATSLYFELKSKLFTDSTSLPYFIVNNNATFIYQLNEEKILLQNMFSSNSNFFDYQFKIADDQLSFTIDKFFNRPNLPLTLQFIKQ